VSVERRAARLYSKGPLYEENAQLGVWICSIDGQGKGKTLGVGMLFIEANSAKIEEMGAVITAAKPAKGQPSHPVAKPSFVAVLLSWLHGMATL
jgi:hypothetical protein